MPKKKKDDSSCNPVVKQNALNIDIMHITVKFTEMRPQCLSKWPIVLICNDSSDWAL